MTSWLDNLMPNEYLSSVYELDLDKLWQDGKRVILTDLDNTLVPWNAPAVPDPLKDLIEQARVHGFQVCIISNNKSRRVTDFAAQIGVPAVGSAKKPAAQAFVQALNSLGAAPGEAVMVGDQLFTDIQGGNRCGLYTVLVLPIHAREWWGTRIVRQVERVTLHVLKRRGLRTPTRKTEER